MEKVAVIGGGSWGSALAIVLAQNGYQVNLRDISPEQVEEINDKRSNNNYLPGVKFPDNITATTDLEEAVKDVGLVVVVVPSHVIREVAKELKGLISADTLVVSATKGIEDKTYHRMSEVLKDELRPELHDDIAVLSGPSHAEEVSRGIPTTVVVASQSRQLAERIQDIFMSDTFRVYTNPDIVGVELGGALKNIIAIAAGIADGLGYGDNTQAALITRGLTEIKRLGIALGADPMTFAGLSGMGDLVVTCASQHSRNRRLGTKIGSGKSLEEALDEMVMVAEGVRTAKAAYHLARDRQVEVPIINKAYEVLFKGKDPQQGVNELMQRGKKHEIEEVVSNKDNW
ncbi:MULTISPECIES: NAD(P)H-dependent glycerol-3-phosphate dehydrogenase [unclassified Candidatus Frackibacter]|uniref:NAD(P)H-dependent glycerol-3-phosphate dehydrogenase n=1 Tax=unclassified Candidatus Frackibacter TaxID=2648818 RepID=UPI0007941821|nr:MULTISPECIES: NAD(P)H-dependent glycerol-3-phosphate dehydrogenase [unclassified Candidatus Frackibacter]KXS42311.1 MAG: glycerol-3-phosphate dehydrogenase (NAD(P)+) [Candidatus Frackibacter sp. T328-2]SDC52528.1 glycerol 3-phosphate dehydrogenase (NAD(P)+) [Candidatus Frackibacter sp. WG11]SEM41610.1 glycerol 3-phosphate dehydrogenase (NAD(P)+) [Candidatus Frackibacter sp. WG12]SFL76326.1 glycerol 3-phosphate dehydrogenase (NAD(P)+) [Candidatus Frackibacter sp. WG13]